MSYQVIARKWRPQKFSDMVGQEHLARTLKNAIMTDRIAHAYLFVGPRGIGKTTTARIFAKAINCLHPIDGEPCCQCSSCKSIADETNVDVIEIDAATHTQVEKARELCEDVLHLPISSKYKIYIIDEVHMLSKSAWNALLKTIEEPPAHAKFIFATTEVNKVLPTVISRCQRFDLRRIKASDIAGRLRLICDTEHVNITDAALQIIARAADGGMRDAQSLLDQMISFFGTGSEGGQITEEQALSLFGLAATGDMEMLMRAIVSNDRAAAVTAVHRFAEAGKNLEMLYEEIVAWLRGILLCRIVDHPAEILEESPERIELYRSIAAGANPGAIQRLMEQLSASGYLLREAINKQVFMESILLKAMRIAHAVQIEDLVARLNQLRRAGDLDAVRSVVPIYEMPVGQIVVPKDSVLAPASNRTIETKIVSAEEYAREQKNVIPAEKPVEKPQQVEAPCPAPVAVPEPEPAPAAPQDPVPEEKPVEEPQPLQQDDIPAEPKQSEPAEPTEQTESADLPEPPPDTRIADDLPDQQVQSQLLQDNYTPDKIWQELIIDMRDYLKKETLAVAMADATPEQIVGSTLSVAFDQDYESFQCMTTERDAMLIARRLRDLSGDPDAALVINHRTGLATVQQVNQREDVERLKDTAAANPMVQDVLDLFHGHLADAHDLGKQPENESGK